MKIPTPEFGQVRTRPLGLAQENHNFDTGTGALVRGIGAVGGAIETAQALNDKRAAKAKERADAAAVDSLAAQAQEATTKGLHGYDEPEANGTPGKHVVGYLDTKGHEAHKQSGDFTTKLQKTYDKLLGLAANPEQKDALTKYLTKLKGSVQLQVAEHEGRQLKAAEIAASKSLLDATLRNATALYNKQDELKPFIDEALSSIKRNSLPEEYEARARDFLADVSVERIGAYIDAGDLQGAEAQLDTDGEVLGGKVAGRLREHLEFKKQAAKQQADEIEAQTRVDAVVKAETNAFGFIDKGKENALRAAIKDVKPEQRKAMQAIVEHAINIEQQRRQDTIDAWTAEAKTLRVRGGTKAIYPELRKKLEDYNPDYIQKIREDDLQRWEHNEAKNTGKAAAKAAEAKQKALNRIALKRMKTLPMAEQAEYEAKHGLEGLGLDEEGKLDLQVQQRKARDWVQKGYDKAKEALDNELDADPALKAKALKKEDPDARFRLRIDAAEGLEDFIEAHGRAPDPKERKEILSEALLKEASRPREVLGIELSPGLEYPYQRKQREATGGEETVRVRSKETGKTGRMPKSKFDPSKYDLVTK